MEDDMCLTTKDPIRQKWSGIAYKVVIKTDSGGLYPLFVERPRLPMNRWIVDKSDYSLDVAGRTGFLLKETYRTGYHAYLTKRDAIRFAERVSGVAVKIQFRRVTATGTQYIQGSLARTVVARKIKLLEIV
jgi:hypothetical protein